MWCASRIFAWSGQTSVKLLSWCVPDAAMRCLLVICLWSWAQSMLQAFPYQHPHHHLWPCETSIHLMNVPDCAIKFCLAQRSDPHPPLQYQLAPIWPSFSKPHALWHQQVLPSVLLLPPPLVVPLLVPTAAEATASTPQLYTNLVTKCCGRPVTLQMYWMDDCSILRNRTKHLFISVYIWKNILSLTKLYFF